MLPPPHEIISSFFHTTYRILQLMWIKTRKCLRKKRKGYHIYWASLSESYLKIIVVLMTFWSCLYFCCWIGSLQLTWAFEKALRVTVCDRVGVYHNLIKAAMVFLGGSWCSQLATGAPNKSKSRVWFSNFHWKSVSLKDDEIVTVWVKYQVKINFCTGYWRVLNIWNLSGIDLASS